MGATSDSTAYDHLNEAFSKPGTRESEMAFVYYQGQFDPLMLPQRDQYCKVWNRFGACYKSKREQCCP